MLIPYPYYKILFIFKIVLCAFSFETKIGSCHIQDSLNKKEMIRYIRFTTNDLINQFGEIYDKQPFYIK